MRRIPYIGLTLLAFACLAGPLWAGPPRKTFRYPKVYGPTGNVYGPTQAHAQYERQYGRPWHGYGGLSATVPHSAPSVGHHSFLTPNYGPYGYTAYGYVSPFAGDPFYPPPALFSGYVSVPGFTAEFPIGLRGAPAPHPNMLPPNALVPNAAIADALRENEERWNGPIKLEPAPAPLVRKPQPSTPAAQLRSIRLQAQGDQWLKRQHNAQAYAKYRDAVTAAPDRAEAYLRKSLALVAIRLYDRAIQELKRGLEIDPALRAHDESLTDIFGEDNVLAKNALLLDVSEWVREDVRDPERLFLMGALLHFDGNHSQAGPFFETAWRLGDQGHHVTAFLRSRQTVLPQDDVRPTQPKQPARPNDVAPGVPTDETDAAAKPPVIVPGLPPIPTIPSSATRKAASARPAPESADPPVAVPGPQLRLPTP